MSQELYKYNSVNTEEVAKFSQLSDDWWDTSGPMRMLHSINPCRLKYIIQQLKNHYGLSMQSPGLGAGGESITNSLTGLSILDIGCGGGIVSVPLARLGARVTGLDPSRESITVAENHAKAQQVNAAFRCSTIEDFSEGPYDTILMLEVIEHAEDAGVLLKSAWRLLQPGGLLILSTFNRTARSFLEGIVMAEYILGLIPRGTHSWKQFYKPSEIIYLLQRHHITNAEVVDATGYNYNLMQRDWCFSSNLSVNYFLTLRKAE